MSCERIRESLWLFDSDDLSAEERGAVQRHLDGCGDCSRELDETRKLVGALPKSPRMNASELDRYVSKTMARIERAGARPAALRIRWAPAAAALFIAVGSIFYFRLQERAKMNEVIANLEMLEHLDEVEHG